MNRVALRLVVVEDPAGEDSAPARSGAESLRCTYKSPEDDFFCWKFQLWYPMIDCAYRNLYRTCTPCADCAQGSRNLERRAADVMRRRWFGDPAS